MTVLGVVNLDTASILSVCGDFNKSDLVSRCVFALTLRESTVHGTEVGVRRLSDNILLSMHGFLADGTLSCVEESLDGLFKLVVVDAEDVSDEDC